MDFSNNKSISTLFSVLSTSELPGIKAPDVAALFKEAKSIEELTASINEKYGKELVYLSMIQPFIQTKHLKTIAGWVTFLGILVLLGVIFTIIGIVGLGLI